MSDGVVNLAKRRNLKKYGLEEPRLAMQAYGNDGYALIDVPMSEAAAIRDAIDTALKEHE